MVSQCSGPARGHWTDGQTEISAHHWEACESHSLERGSPQPGTSISLMQILPVAQGVGGKLGEKGPGVLGSGTCMCSVSAGQTGGGLQVWMGSVPRLA